MGARGRSASRWPPRSPTSASRSRSSSPPATPPTGAAPRPGTPTPEPGLRRFREKAAEQRRPRAGQPRATRSPPASAVLEVVDAENPPLRIFFGDGPLAIATKDYESRLATWRGVGAGLGRRATADPRSPAGSRLSHHDARCRPPPADPLAGWSVRPRSPPPASPTTSTRAGPGPGVVLLPEIPGMTPQVMGLANHLVDAGFTVAVPSLFGEPGRAMSAGYAAAHHRARPASRASSRPSPAAPTARSPSTSAPSPGTCTPGPADPGVGVIGMCFTGGFALAAAVEPAVLAPGRQPAVGAVPDGRRPQARPGDVRARAGRRRRAGAHRGPLPGRAAVQRGLRVAGRPVHRAREGVRPGLARHPAELEARQPRRHRQARALGAHQRRRRQARPPDPCGPRRDHRLPAASGCGG